MEHFELHEKYRASLPQLRESLDHMGLSDRGVESLSNILDNHFIGLFEQCNNEGRQKDYRNRHPKPQQPQLRPKQRSFRKRAAITAHRDSGVDVGMEDAAGDAKVVEKFDNDGDETPQSALESSDVQDGQSQYLNAGAYNSGDRSSRSWNLTGPVEGYRNIFLPAGIDATALQGHYHTGYAPVPNGYADLEPKTNSGTELLPVEYQVSGSNSTQLGGQFGISSSLSGLGEESMADFHAWIYTQEDPRL
jgi:hypothetical protein